MKAATSRRARAELRGGAAANGCARVGGRTVHHFWPLLSPYFREMLLAPHRRIDGDGVYWEWEEPVPSGPPGPRELRELRRRLENAGEMLAENLARVEGAAVRAAEGGGGGNELARTMQGEVLRLVGYDDAVLARFVARTHGGGRLHSWGAEAPADVIYPDDPAPVERADLPPNGTLGRRRGRKTAAILALLLLVLAAAIGWWRSREAAGGRAGSDEAAQAPASDRTQAATRVPEARAGVDLPRSAAPELPAAARADRAVERPNASGARSEQPQAESWSGASFAAATATAAQRAGALPVTTPAARPTAQVHVPAGFVPEAQDGPRKAVGAGEKAGGETVPPGGNAATQPAAGGSAVRPGEPAKDQTVRIRLEYAAEPGRIVAGAGPVGGGEMRAGESAAERSRLPDEATADREGRQSAPGSERESTAFRRPDGGEAPSHGAWIALGPWRLRLLVDVIVPTLPQREDGGPAVRALVAQLAKEHHARRSWELEAAVVGAGLEFQPGPAHATEPLRWMGPGAAWREGAGVQLEPGGDGRWRLEHAMTGQVLAVVDVEHGRWRVRARDDLRVRGWVSAPVRWQWRRREEAALPVAWEEVVVAGARRAIFPLAAARGHALALFDPGTGWARVSEISGGAEEPDGKDPRP